MRCFVFFVDVDGEAIPQDVGAFKVPERSNKIVFLSVSFHLPWRTNSLLYELLDA